MRERYYKVMLTVSEILLSESNGLIFPIAEAFGSV